jgi:hypothetical protein
LDGNPDGREVVKDGRIEEWLGATVWWIHHVGKQRGEGKHVEQRKIFEA